MKKYLQLWLFLLSVFATFSLNAQSNYCTPTYNGSGIESRWFCHLLNVSFADINRTTAAPYNYNWPNYIYDNLTYISTDVVPGQTYPLSIMVGNGANTQYVTAWIDFNQNKIFESTERVILATDYANQGDHIVRGNVTIPANAVLGQTRMRVGSNIILTQNQAAPDPCVNNETANLANVGPISSQHFQDFTINILKPKIQYYVSSNTIQLFTTDEVTVGSTDNPVIRIDVKTNSDGILSPLQVDSFFFSLLGTTNPNEISNAKLYYTGISPEFTANSQVGSTVGSPGTYFTINAAQQLQPGTNYFWLTYDISSTAIISNKIDARCNGVFIDIRRIPQIIDPSGNRTIGYCVSKGTKQFIYVRGVNLRDINRTGWPYYDYSGYQNWTNYSTNLYKGIYHILSVETGNGVNSNAVQAWIDFDRDGYFNNTTEKVLDDSLLITTTPPYIYGPVVDSFMIPINAPLGKTRMRITAHYNPNNPPRRPRAKPCENPVEIGEIEDYTIIIADSGQAVADFSSTIDCLGDSTTFTDKSYVFGTTYQVSAWQWDFGDGNNSTLQNPRHKYAAAGVYNVKLTAVSNNPNAVISTTTKPVKVNSPVANFSITTNLYKQPIQFIDETSGGETLPYPNGNYWDFGDPKSGYNNYSQQKSPFHTYNDVGNYLVTMIATSEGGCKDTIKKMIHIDSIIPPIANFSAETFNPYYQQKVEFLDVSVYDPTYWRWEISPNTFHFHDSTNKYSKAPVISFDNIGVYAVRMFVSNNAGSDSVTKVITTKNYTKPVADFTADPLKVKAGQAVSFLDKSQNDPNQWIWSFGDNDSAFVQHPQKAYSNTGYYTISMKASNPAGSDTKIQSNYIQVTNEYKMCDNEAPYSNLFAGLLYDDGGRNGDYSNNSNCGFLIKPECSGPITLSFSSFNMDVGDYLYVYDGETADPATLLTPSGLTGSSIPSSLVAKSGSMYIVELTNSLQTASGFIANWSAVPNIAPRAVIGADTVGYVHGPVRFLNKTTLGAGNTYYWDYTNDGQIDDIFTSKDIYSDGHYAYDKLGYYTVKLEAENCKGRDSVKHTIHIIQPTSAPVAAFTVLNNDTIVSEGERVYFEDMSTMGPTGWKWEVTPPDYWSIGYFADGTADTSQNPIIQFYGLGGYDISLTATNTIGSSQKLVKKKYILVIPQVTMGAWPFERDEEAGKIFDSGGETGNYSNNEDHTLLIDPCAEEVYLSFNSFDLAPGDYLRIYDGKDKNGKPLHPGNGFGGSIKPTTTLVAESGAMFLEMVTDFGNTGQGFEAMWTIKPIQKPDALFESPDTAYTGGHIILFTNKSTGKEIEKYYWNYDNDATIDDSTFNGQYAYPGTGYNFPRLQAVNCAGSGYYFKQIDIIAPTQKPKADFEADILRADITDIITFADKSDFGPNKWEWDFGTPKVTYENSQDTVFPRALIKYDTTGTFDVRLIASNKFGADTMVKPGYITIFSYCNPTVQNPLIDFGISRVRVSNLDNITEAGVSQYTDYTRTHSVNFEIGGTYTFEINSIEDNYPYERKIWIDFNKDGVFNDSTIVKGELVALGHNTNTISWTGTLTIPPNVSLGQTRMRVGVDYGGYNDKPCGPNFFGEFEDYRVYITEDHTAPRITLKGNPIAFVEVGKKYIDSGATAWDAVDGDLSAYIQTIDNIDTSKVGEYWVKYNVADNSNNQADEVRRRVFVTPDLTPPVITLQGDNPMSIALGFSYSKLEPGAMAWDERDGDVSSLVQIEQHVDSSRVDTFTVFYSAYDFNGNSTFADRTVYVIDSISPVIHLIGEPHVWIKKAGGTYVDSGAYVTDNYYKNLKINTATNLDVDKVGWYWYKYNATDLSGNKAIEVERTIRVGDPIGINETLLDKNIRVYPNPAKDIINVEVKLPGIDLTSLDLINPVGKHVLRMEMNETSGKLVQLNVAGLAAGVYVLRLSAGDVRIFRKVGIVR